ncbi:hypothetical protein HME9304_01790 [Flagellimonas maritima]|uniref:Uncharacterized protein n=1 Tax=Flagellimonas maritima TaxID=1383885 RepID=A0A2Z4LSB4_9FLAO|nr:hypothetical protein [Allomuricauda aurantiaca]AWX44785.1 hypothetical protein HME9304_01790 [Allomuricauda aurantiaca]
MGNSENENPNRLKVEKGLERQAMVLGFRLKYLGIFGVLFFLSLVPLMGGVSFNMVVFVIIINTAAFMFVKYADDKNLLDKLSPMNYPKILINDLYKKLKSGANQSE